MFRVGGGGVNDQEKRTELIVIRATETEKKNIQDKATKQKKSVSQFVRDQAKED